jgi:predicted kinase
MPKLIIMVGAPASGKSTIVRGYQSEGFVKISFDDLHQSFFGCYDFSKHSFVMQCATKIFKEAVSKNLNIAVDNTNMKQRFINNWKSLAPGYEVIVQYMETSVEECLKRNLQRDRGSMNIPGEVIIRMFQTSDVPEMKKLWEEFCEQ